MYVRLSCALGVIDYSVPDENALQVELLPVFGSSDLILIVHVTSESGEVPSLKIVGPSLKI